MLTGGCFTLQRKDGTRPAPVVGMIEIDDSLLHDLLDFGAADADAIHPAKRIPGVNKRSRMAFESLFFDRLVPAPDKKGQKNEHQKKQRQKSISLLHAAK